MHFVLIAFLIQAFVLLTVLSPFLWIFLGKLMQSYPSRALDRKLQEDWARDAREDPRIFMSLRVDFGSMS